LSVIIAAIRDMDCGDNDDSESIRFRHPSAIARRGRDTAGGFAGAAFRPVAQGGDLAVHQLGERHGAGHRVQDVLGTGFAAVGIRFVHGIDEHGFDFRTGELLAGTGQGDGIKISGLAAVAFDDDVPDLRALRGVG